MLTILLDGGISTKGLQALFFTVIALLILIILIEAVVMLFFNFNKFGKCLLDSFLVNLASLIAGFILSSLNLSISVLDNPGNITVILIALLVTIVVEGWVLQLLNMKKPAKKVWLVCAVMNIISYAALIGFYYMFG